METKTNILALLLLMLSAYSEERLTGSSGFFTSPNFPNNFPQYSNCTWNITVPNGYIIKVTFQNFILGWTERGGARVTITNFASDDGRGPPLQLDGFSLPYPVYSVGNSIEVIFTSQAYQYSGFNASYKAITYDSLCSNMTTLNETSGVITSPFYPRHYPGYRECRWQITASKGNRVVMIIEDMDIQSCGQTCTCGHLEVQNGLSSDGYNDARRCGNRRVRYYSMSESLTVLFVSDGSQWWYGGFKATYIQANHTASIPACSSGDILTGSSGFFASPNFPNNFPRYSRCIWNITVPSGYIIKLTFHHFELGPNDHHNTALVTITNVASDDDRQPFQLDDQSVPSPVYSVGNSIQVIFSTLTEQYSGFNASYRSITYESVCPNMTTLNETSGIITSPFYPRNYPGYRECRWQITASKGKRVVMSMEDMDIETGEQTCSCDFLEVQNGFSSDGYNDRRRCGSIYDGERQIYYSMSESLTVLFVSDCRPSKWSRGFKATYIQASHTAPIPACSSGDILTGSSGFFASPNFPNNFPQYSRCIWNITVPNGYIIKLTFHHFDLGPYYFNRALVTITNVASDDNRQPFQLVGQSIPSPVYSVGNSIQVIFSTLAEQFSGFSASYRAITYESVCPKLAILNETSGVITSPFYPRYNTVNQTCSWKISARKGERINLVIEKMDIFTNWDASCPHGYLEIKNDSYSSNSSSGRICGYVDGNARVFSSVENLIVLFVPGFWSYLGFKATYHLVNSHTVSTEPSSPTPATRRKATTIANVVSLVMMLVISVAVCITWRKWTHRADGNTEDTTELQIKKNDHQAPFENIDPSLCEFITLSDNPEITEKCCLAKEKQIEIEPAAEEK